MTITRITPSDAGRWKAARLRALLDAPTAFGATYARVSQWTDADWHQRATDLNGPRQAGYLAVGDGGEDVGMAAGVLNEADATLAHLISMWVAPTHRGRGVGRLVVAAVADWARSRGGRTLRLDVTSANGTALAFYGRLGFEPTGRITPYPNDAALTEVEMNCPL